MAKQAFREKPVQAEHPVAAGVERLEPEAAPLEAPEVPLGVAAPPARIPALIN